MELKPKNLGLAGGIVCGVGLSLATVANLIMPSYGTEFIQVFASIYQGYESTWLGALLALIYGFLDGFIALFLVGWVYNKIDQCCSKK